MTTRTNCYCIKTVTIHLHREETSIFNNLTLLSTKCFTDICCFMTHINTHQRKTKESINSSWIRPKKVYNTSVKLDVSPHGKSSVPMAKKYYLHLDHNVPATEPV